MSLKPCLHCEDAATSITISLETEGAGRAVDVDMNDIDATG